MTSTTSGNAAGGDRPRPARTDVHAVPLETITDPAVHRAVRLIQQLAKVFPDQIIELDVTPSTPSHQET